MSDWTSGYVADIGYTFGYYAELGAERVTTAFLNSGLVAPEIGVACELGFGQGVSTNMHAAATVTHWHGTDFNPAQASFAQELASAGGSGASLYDQAFAEFCNRADLPDFDFIGLHGIWSWISDENRHVIVDFVRRKLKVGGVLYVSYNTQPGWAAMVPMRHLLTEHAKVMGSKGQGILSRVGSALEFGEKLLGVNPGFVRANPGVTERFSKLMGMDKHYLAHEYFNRDWVPMPFAKMAEWLEPAKVDFACSANLFDHIDAINLTPEQQAMVKDVPDADFRQTVRDYIVNQQFRRDYWVKGLRRTGLADQSARWRRSSVVLVTPRQDVKLTATGAVGEATLQASIYAPILDALADHKIQTIAQLERTLGTKNIGLAQLLQAIVILSAKGDIMFAQTDEVQAQVMEQCQRINARLMHLAQGQEGAPYLASPVTGGGVAAPRFHQLFIRAIMGGRTQAAEIAKDTWEVLKLQREQVLKDGKPLVSPEENLAELTQQATDFLEKRAPVLRALRVM